VAEVLTHAYLRLTRDPAGYAAVPFGQTAASKPGLGAAMTPRSRQYLPGESAVDGQTLRATALRSARRAACAGVRSGVAMHNIRSAIRALITSWNCKAASMTWNSLDNYADRQYV
jgi:hypothetical protein